jgi:hypothetical protein
LVRHGIDNQWITADDSIGRIKAELGFVMLNSRLYDVALLGKLSWEVLNYLGQSKLQICASLLFFDQRNQSNCTENDEQC